MPSHRSRRGRRRRTHIQLDPHYFVGRFRGRRQGAVPSTHTPRSWVQYEITIEEVLADLAYGQD